jgi:hypothetical protein
MELLAMMGCGRDQASLVFSYATIRESGVQEKTTHSW